MAHPQSTFRETAFHGRSMLSQRRKTIARVTMHTQLEQMHSTGRYDCFKLKWHPIYSDKSMWPVPFHLFWDSDIAKWIEGACYFLASEYDEVIDHAVQDLVQMIRGAQQEDGYLNVHFTVVEPKKRWSNLRDMHELYNAGHLIEAAIAHRNYYRNDLLLEPIQRYVALIRKTFGPGENQIRGYPGHPEIELALFRLYSEAGNQDAYELAQFFLEERGNTAGQGGKHYYDWEEEQRGESPYTRPDPFPEKHAYWYCQAHQPILERESVEGHSVREMYLLTAAADMVCFAHTGDRALADANGWKTAIDRLWNNMVDKKMYVTGGIGAIKQWEGFGIDYFLPQGTDEGGCYAETCASIGVMMLAERLLHIDLDRRYGDIMELSLYNTVMTAMSLDGKAFTYENQLASSDKDKSIRADWFWCACCPPNLMRLFGSLGGYLWDYGGNSGDAYVNIHLYTTAKVVFDVDDNRIELEQISNWPSEGSVMFQLSSPESCRVTLRLRLPAWSGDQYVLTPTPAPEDISLSKGYLTLTPTYLKANPSFTLQIQNFAPRYIEPHPYTNQATVALARGPVIYCVEDADNAWEDNHFKNVAVLLDRPVTEEKRVHEEAGEEYVALKATCRQRCVGSWARKAQGNDPGLASQQTTFGDEREIVFVPYYLRANRSGKGHMRVGLLKA